MVKLTAAGGYKIMVIYLFAIVQSYMVSVSIRNNPVFRPADFYIAHIMQL